jgi:hypothetical protein
MPQFAALIYEAPRPTPENPNFASYMQGYMDFGEKAGTAIVGGAALLGPETATTLEVRGGSDGELVQTDGPYAETKEFLGGFYLLEAEDLDAAVAIARHIPAASDGGRVEVRPLMPM